MGCGKSTVGLYLQKKYGLSFIDTDSYITETYRKEIPAIFEEDGEATFRKYEVETLISLTNYDIIATGGGIVEKEENRVKMSEQGIVVYLQASFHEIMNRLKHDATRPLWNQDVAEREKLYTRRHEIYTSFADEVVQTDDMRIEDIGETIMAYRQGRIKP